MNLLEETLNHTITLIFPGEPKPKQSTRFRSTPFINPKTGKLQYAYQDPKVVSNQNTIQWQAVQQLPKPFQAWDGKIIVLSALYVFPIPSSLTKKEIEVIRNGGIVYKPTKPDLTDNLQKAFFDALQGILFTNDSRIVHIKEAMKIYGFTPRTEFVFMQIP